MRTLHIGVKLDKHRDYPLAGIKYIGGKESDGYFAHIPLSDQSAENLMAADIIYECGVDHDLHINPEKFTELDAVEELLLNIVTDQAPW